MHIDPLAAALWIADFLGSGCVLYVLLRYRLRWPSLITLLSTDLVVWIALAIIHRHYRWYFYTYWIWTAVDSALRLWLLSDCLRSIPGTGFIPRNARMTMLTMAGVMAVGAALLSLHGDGWSPRVILDAILLYNQAACFAVLAFCAVSFGTVALLGLGWERVGARIASGLGLELALLAFRSAAFTEHSRSLRALADYAANLSHLIVLLMWLSALLTSRRYGGRPRHSPPYLERRVVQPI